MTDIASLGLKIDSTQAVEAKTDLDRFTASAVKAETATEALGNQAAKAQTPIQALASAQSAAARGADYLAKAGAGSITTPVQALVAAQNAAKASLTNTAKATDQATISAGQYKQALRQLPAQITDIVTGLASGQTAFTVFIQQGGQIKDSFGGAGNALKALAGFLNPAVIAFGALAATAAGLFLIFKKGQDDAFELQKSITLTGNAAGVTAGQLGLMADSITKVAGTHSQAVAALSAVTATGQVPAQLIQQVAQLALELQRTAGKAVDQTVQEFAALGDRPLDAVEALQKKYNFLTTSVYDQIRALENEGRTSDAAATAQGAFLDALQKRTTTLKNDVGILQRLWQGVANTVRGAGDAILSIGRPASPQEQLANLRRQRGTRVLGSTTNGPIDPFAAEAGLPQIADQQRTNDALEQSLAKIVEQRRKDAQATADQATQYKNYAAALISANTSIQAALDLGKQSGSNAQQALQNATQIALAQIAVQDDALEASRNANLISDEQYYAAKAKLITQSGSVQANELAREADLIKRQIANNDTLFEALRANASSPEQANQLAVQQRSEQIALEGQLADVEARRRQIAIETSRQIQQTNVAEASSVAALTRTYADLVANSQRYVNSLKEQYSLTIGGIGQGQQARDRAANLQQIQDDFRRQQERLQDDLRNGRIQQPQFDISTQILEDGLHKAEQAYADYYKDLQAKQGDWLNGAKEAFNNYVDAAKNVSNLADQAFTNAFQSMEDAIVGLATTGKFSFKDLANSILADLIRMEVKILESKALEAIFGGILGGLAGGAGSLSGSSGVGELSGSTVGFAAGGGDISGPTIVGEEGPELIVPRQPSTVISNKGLRGLGGGPQINITNHNSFGAGANTAQISAELDRRDAQIQSNIYENLRRNRWIGAVAAR